ncbi:hypothetical protein [Mesobacillus subterraneus]|uniref:Uncharacterized protein n=1 Tax=Mesobacillus subterraneus TaxID=285983 RepID=A0A427TM80_9BACI|nr:hypothetical protein [Mesobacillus subterraneus]RSD25462.1 hypothetical protein EJA10_16785 [Mesobacillus subterraneus]
MDNWLFIFIANLLGGIFVFYLLSFLFSGFNIDSSFFIGIFLFIQLSFITTLIFHLMHRVNQLEKEARKREAQ